MIIHCYSQQLKQINVSNNCMEMMQVTTDKDIKEDCLNHLRFADNIIMISDTPEQLHCIVQELHNSSTGLV